MRRWRHWTLRRRLVVAFAVLAAIGLALTTVAGMELLRSYLLGRVDRQLAQQARGMQQMSGGLPMEVIVGYSRGPSPFGPSSRQVVINGAGVRIWPTSTDATGDQPDLTDLGAIRISANDREPYTVDGTNGTSWRVLAVPVANADAYTVTAVSLHDIEATQDQMLLIGLGVSAAVLLAIGIAAATVVRLGLRPLTRMERTAEGIADGDLSGRVPDTDPHTESGRLGRAFNAMVDRIEAALTARTASERRLRRFLADASHELRTPLTSIQGFAELYRRGGARSGPELDEAMGRIEAEVGRMRLLVEDLLLLARLDEERPIEQRPVDLLEIAAEAVRDAHIRVPTRFIRLEPVDDLSDGTADEGEEEFAPVEVLGDEPRLRQVMTNLIANALQHTPEDAEVTVRVGHAVPAGVPAAAVGDPPDRPVVAVEVADTGPGLSPADAAQVFERLYRADPSRSRRHGGAGLGLSIVAAIVRAHGGRVELYTAPGRGARFRVLIPARVG